MFIHIVFVMQKYLRILYNYLLLDPFIWLLISEDRLMSSVAKLLVKLFEKRYTLLNGGVASLSS